VTTDKYKKLTDEGLVFSLLLVAFCVDVIVASLKSSKWVIGPGAIV